MKLAVVGPSYPFKSGISHFTTILVGQLRRQHGREAVDFINWQRQYPGWLYPVDPVDKASTQTITEDNIRLLDFYNPLSWYRAARRIKAHGTDRLVITWVSMAQSPPYLGLWLCLWLMGRPRITYLCHNALPHDPYFFERLANRLMFRLADDFIVHSRDDARDLAGLAGHKPCKIGFHPAYDDFNTGQTFDSAAIRRQLKLKGKVVLFFGFIRRYKGLDDLIEAIAIARRTDKAISLLVVGEFWKHDKPAYDELVARHGLTGSVVFVDRFVPNEEVGRYFAVADILAAPYHSATQSGVIQMAYAFDTPVVATRVGGLPEAVEEAVSGFLCQPRDPDGLARTITAALAHDGYDVARVKRRFSWQTYIKTVGLDG